MESKPRHVVHDLFRPNPHTSRRRAPRVPIPVDVMGTVCKLNLVSSSNSMWFAVRVVLAYLLYASCFRLKRKIRVLVHNIEILGNIEHGC